MKGKRKYIVRSERDGVREILWLEINMLARGHKMTNKQG